MNYLILASHGAMAKGIQDTLEVIIGKQENISAYSFYRNDEVTLAEVIEKKVEQHYLKKDIYILTDIFGGSVNNELMGVYKKYPRIKLISGMNLPLVMSLAVQSTKLEEEEVKNIIAESQQAIVDCGKLIKESSRKEDIL